jgi:hypothetical protein
LGPGSRPSGRYYLYRDPSRGRPTPWNLALKRCRQGHRRGPMSRPYARSEYELSACIGSVSPPASPTSSLSHNQSRCPSGRFAADERPSQEGADKQGRPPTLSPSPMSYFDGSTSYPTTPSSIYDQLRSLMLASLSHCFGDRSRCLYGVVALFFSWPKPIGPVPVSCRGCRWTMLENLFSTAVVLFVGYILIEGIARWMLDRRHSRSPPKDPGD